MRSRLLVLLLILVFVLQVSGALRNSPWSNVTEVTVKVDNSSLSYPDSLLLLPLDLPEDQRNQLLSQLGRDVTDNHVTSREEAGDVGEVVRAVVRAAETQLQAQTANTGTKEERDGAAETLQDSAGPRRRRRRTTSRIGARVRRAYTQQWQDICDSCPSLSPQQPVIINIIKTGSGCEGDCTSQSKQPVCGQPQCGTHFPHHPPPFNPPPPPHLHHWPPPPPPPHFHHYPPPPPPPPPQFYPQPSYNPPAQPMSTTPKPMSTTPKPMTRPPQRPSPPNCDPCAASSGQGGAPSYSGSFSQSSASAQSSSFAWSG